MILELRRRHLLCKSHSKWSRSRFLLTIWLVVLCQYGINEGRWLWLKIIVFGVEELWVCIFRIDLLLLDEVWSFEIIIIFLIFILFQVYWNNRLILLLYDSFDTVIVSINVVQLNWLVAAIRFVRLLVTLLGIYRADKRRLIFFIAFRIEL